MSIPLIIKRFWLPFFIFFCATSLTLLSGCEGHNSSEKKSSFYIASEEGGNRFSVFREGSNELVLIQNAFKDMRPYLHPIMAPDGKGSLTEYSPGHHKHQTGLYWGFTRVNGTGAPADTLKKWFYNREKPPRIKDQIGRDYFHFNGESHWKRIDVKIIVAEGEEVKWQTVYHMLDESGNPILEETMNWSMTEDEHKFLIGLTWEGKAIEDITINEFSYGGMFLRMPWTKGIEGEATNSNGQLNQEAEGQKSKWVDVGMEIEGRDDWGHIAILDHISNSNHPTPWRVDGQLGIGPCRAIDGDWNIPKGQIEVIQHQIVAYSGELNAQDMNLAWETYSRN